MKREGTGRLNAVLNWLIIVLVIAVVIGLWRLVSPPSKPGVSSQAFPVSKGLRTEERQDKGVVAAESNGVLLQRKISVNRMLQSEE